MKPFRFLLTNKLYYVCLALVGIGSYFLYEHSNNHQEMADAQPVYIISAVKDISVTAEGSRMNDYIYLEGYKNPLKIEQRHAKAYYKALLIKELHKGDAVQAVLSNRDAEKLGKTDETLTLYGLKNSKGVYLDDVKTFSIDKSPDMAFYIGAGAFCLAILIFLLGWYIFKIRF